MASEHEKKLLMDIIDKMVTLGVSKDPAILAACVECIEVIHKHVCGEDDEE